MKKIILILLLLIESTANAQWTPLPGFQGGNVTSLLVESGLGLAVTGGQLFSAPLGTSWNRVANSPQKITDLLLIGSFSQGNSKLFAAADKGEVYLSSDFGSSWKSVSSGLSGNTLTRFASIPGFPSKTIFVGTDGNGIYRTTNDGLNWTAVNSGLKGEALYVADITYYSGMSGPVLIAATSDGMYVSTDKGDSWSVHNTGITYTTIYGTFMNRVATNDKYIFASTIDLGQRGKGLYRSSNEGKTLTQINTGLSDSVIESIGFIGSQIFVGTSHHGIFKSLDNGGSWNSVGVGLKSRGVHCLAFSGNKLFAGAEGGCYVSSDSGTYFQMLANGLSAGFVSVGTLFKNDSMIFAGTSEFLTSSYTGAGGYFSRDNGASWLPVNTPYLSGGVMGFAQLGNVFFAGTTDSALYRSTDNAKTWNPCNSGKLLYDRHVRGLGALSDRIYVCIEWPDVGYYYTYFSADTGITWQSPSLPDKSHGGNDIHCFFQDSNDWFAGGFGLLRTQDSGKNWEFADTGYGKNPPSVNAIVKMGSDLFEGTDGTYGVWRSSDRGDHWVSMNNGLPVVYHDSSRTEYLRIFALTASGSNLFAGTYDGVFLWVDSLHRWKNVSDGFDVSNRWVKSLVVSGDNLLAGLSERGIWTRSVAEMVAEQASVPVIHTASKFILENYPNPFTGKTNIYVNSNERGFAMIEVYNVLGEKVSTIFSGNMEAGDRTFAWDAKNMPVGMYSCVVRLNSEVRTIPMILSQSGGGK